MHAGSDETIADETIFHLPIYIRIQSIDGNTMTRQPAKSY